MVGHLYFYDIPVYRVTEAKYSKEMEAYKEKNLKDMQEFYKKYPEQKIHHENHLSKSYGGMWRYNEIIGFIRLHILGTQVRGEYFNTDSKKIVKTRRKQFKYSTHKLAIERELPHKENSPAIYKAILAYLNDCRRELPKRFIDTSLFETIGPYLDWKKLLDQL